MKNVFKLSLITTMFIFVSCNEQVSPELAAGSTSTTSGSTSGGPTITPTEYYFSLTNTSADIFNFKLHKTGLGNATSACEIRQSSQLTTDDFDAGLNDVSCFMEAEELALYFNGMSWDLKASANTCDYIAYAPYSYYNRQPGDSSTSMIEVSCTGSVTPVNIAAAAAGRGMDLTLGAGSVDCGDRVDENIGIGVRQSFPTPESDDDLCRYNYQDGDNEECDVGIINVRTLSVTNTAGVITNDVSSRVVRCGGKPKNCIAGPIKEVSLLANSTRGSVIYNTTWDAEFSQSFSYPAPMATSRSGNFNIVNFRRDLALSTTAFVGDTSYTIGSPGYYDDAAYANSFIGATAFDPFLMDTYARNKQLDNSTSLINTAGAYYLTTVAQAANNYQYTAKPLAAEPFLGIGGYATNPFYVFYCLDNTMDVRARIKVAVREWDRIFPTSSTAVPHPYELISDFGALDARQDRAYDDIDSQNTSDPDTYVKWNDLRDWEDYISMEYLAGPVLRPLPVALYTQGYFDPIYFLNESSDQ